MKSLYIKGVLLYFLFFATIFPTSAQIGYQVSLLDTKTGEPRTNEKVTVSVKISDNKGNILCDETKSVTSDSFGVLSLTIGNENTFTKVDWQNVPLKISASVEGVLIGSSDVLTVPMAEHAKHVGMVTPGLIAGMVVQMYSGEATMIFSANGTATYTDPDIGVKTTHRYEIDGNNVYVFRENNSCWDFYYSSITNKLHYTDD